MSNDLFKSVNFTPGQEVRAVDLANTQKFLGAKLADQIFDHLTPGLLVAAGDPDMRSGQGANAATKWAYALTASGGAPITSLVPGTATDKNIKLSAGTLMQKIAAKDGSEAQLLMFTCDGTQEFTIADGHATLPRVDLLQMKLEYEAGDSQARVFANEAEYAILDFGPLGTLFDTIVRAKVKGLSGHNIQVRCVAGVAAAYAESGNLITLTYDDGVTTVLALETLIGTDSTLIEVQTAGTPASVLVDPDETFAYTALAGGVDTVLVSQAMDMQRRVLATFSVVTGTPAAAPCVIPDPTAGYVAVAAVIVPALWVAAGNNRLGYEDRYHGPAVDTGVMSISVSAPTCRYERVAGSFITDGFTAGHEITVSGFANSSNNGRRTLSVVAALYMETVSQYTLDGGGSLAVEAASGDEQIVTMCSATVVDLRMPLSVKRHTVLAKDMLYADADWYMPPGKMYLQSEIQGVSGTNLQFENITPQGSMDTAAWQTDAAGNFLAAGSGSFEVQVQPRMGWRVCSVDLHVHGNAGGTSDCSANLYVKNGATLTSIAAPGALNVPNSWNVYSDDVVAPATLDDQESMYLQVTGQVGVYIDRITIWYMMDLGSNSLTADLMVPVPSVTGRIVGLTVTSQYAGEVGVDPSNVVAYLTSNDHVTLRNLVRVGGFTGDPFADTTLQTRHASLEIIEDPDETQNVTAKGSATYGLPVWTNGYRAPFRASEEDGDGIIAGVTRDLVLRISQQDDPNQFRIYKVTFFIAEGL